MFRIKQNTSSTFSRTINDSYVPTKIRILKLRILTDTHSYKTEVPTKSMDINIWAIAIENQLFRRGPYTQLNFFKKMKKSVVKV